MVGELPGSIFVSPGGCFRAGGAGWSLEREDSASSGMIETVDLDFVASKLADRVRRRAFCSSEIGQFSFRGGGLVCPGCEGAHRQVQRPGTGRGGLPRLRRCAFPGSEAGRRSLWLDDSVPSGIIMRVRVELS